jgi:hypothetical protein
MTVHNSIFVGGSPIICATQSTTHSGSPDGQFRGENLAGRRLARGLEVQTEESKGEIKKDQ